MRILTTGQFAEMTGVSVRSLYNLERAGLIKPQFLTKGGHRRYNEEQAQELRDLSSNGNLSPRRSGSKGK